MLRSPRDVVLFVVVAMVIGFLLARMAPAPSGRSPTPAPAPAQALASPTPTPEPTDDDRVWQQPLAAGCATANGQVFLVSSGGGIGRFDGAHWALVDETLRQLRAVTCVGGLVVAVGDGGRVIRIDPVERTIRPDVVAQDDLFAIGALDAREIVVGGSDLSVVRLHEGRWDPIGGGGVGLVWHAILARSASEVWLAGDGGTLFVFDGKKFVDRSIADGPDLTALSPFGADTLVGASDGRLFTAAPGHAARQLAGVDGAVRGTLAAADGGAFVLANDLRHMSASGATSALPHGLTCPGVALFGGPAGDVWVIGRDGSRAGVAHYDGSSWTRAGRC